MHLFKALMICLGTSSTPEHFSAAVVWKKEGFFCHLEIVNEDNYPMVIPNENLILL